jgi:IS605 OrfB family transposase
MKKRKKCLETFKTCIKHHCNDLWTPPLELNLSDLHTNSWFDIKYHKTQTNNNFQSSLQFDSSAETTYIKCYKVNLVLDEKQKSILDRWFNSCIMMYNETIKFIKSHRTPENILNYNNELAIFMQQKNSLNQLITDTKQMLKHITNVEEYEIQEQKLRKLNEQQINIKKELHNIQLKYFVKPDYQTIRTYGLKDTRNNIIASSHLRENGMLKYPIPTHIIDCAIKHACSNFKTCLTNLKNENQLHFRIRKIKFSKPYKVMEIEPSYFRYSKQKQKLLTLLYTSLGQVKYSLDGKIYSDLREIKYLDNDKNEQLLFDDIKSACNLRYCKTDQSYCLFIPKTKQIKVEDKPNEIVSIDLGERTFACCLSENEVIKICNNGQAKIKELLDKIDVLQTKKTRSRKKQKLNINYRRKLKNIVNDLHWKTISFLTNKYKNILIGNLSTKGVVNKSKSVLQAKDKRIMYALSFYVFRQRLEYKCKSKTINYKEVNESYTSKTCSKCGCIKDYLGPTKVFNCNNCKLTIDRDINGCRGIYFSSYT